VNEEKTMQRKVAAVVLGIIVAVVFIIAIEALGHSVYPVPEGLDITDTEAMQAYVTGLPIGALLFVMGAWLVATLAGGLLACFIARETPLVYSAVVGGLVLLGTIINLMSVPHPSWFSITSVLAIIAMIFVTGRLGASLARPSAAE
jgi:nicotinamide riboside transporter PnuC